MFRFCSHKIYLFERLGVAEGAIIFSDRQSSPHQPGVAKTIRRGRRLLLSATEFAAKTWI
jgi:hypothetical protein